MGEDANTFNNLRCTVLHQTIVGSDVRFTFGGVDNQSLNLVAAALQFGAGGEACAAQPGDARLVDTGDQLFAAVATVVAPAVAFDPAIFTISVNHYTQLRQGRRVGYRVRSNRRYGTGRGGMNRQHTPAAKGQRLAA